MAAQKGLSQQSKPSVNPLEALNHSGQGELPRPSEHIHQLEAPHAKGVANPEFRNTIFDRTQHNDGQRLEMILREIRYEVAAIKQSSEELAAEVEKVDRVALQELPITVGVYHLRYYEIILQYLRNIRTKVGEARTWMSALVSKKAKRGSAYATRSAKQGSAYTMSSELQIARSVG